MGRTLLLALSMFVLRVSPLLAIDLSTIERPAIKLPEPHSGAVQYCLLVVGPDAATRVWLAHDGDRLYVDRNGNGDLTEPGETVLADPQGSKPAEGVFVFKAGDIPDAAAEHKDLFVTWWNIDHMKSLNATIGARLEREPTFRACRVALDVSMPGHRGQGLDGRVNQTTNALDCQGLLEFAPRVEDAPVIHFGGPWQVTLTGQQIWHVGRKEHVALVVGTPGVGPGTTAAIAYEKVIPAPLKPKLEVTYPASDGATPLVQTYELSERCCHVDLHGNVAVPDEVTPGTATVSISLESWPGATIAATKHDVRIQPAPPGRKTEPISSRLAGKLQHQQPNAMIEAVQFSPDGRRLIAGSNPTGLVQVWEVASGQRLASFDMGKGFRSSFGSVNTYFVVTPDWKTIISPVNAQGKFDRVQRNGKMIARATYDGSLRVWDLESGKLRHTWQDDPPRATSRVFLLPHGNQFCAVEETPGEFESQRPEALSVWDMATGEHQQLFADPECMVGFSPDGKQCAVSVRRTDDNGIHDWLVIYDTAAWKPVAEIPLKEKDRCYRACFLQNPPMVVGTVSADVQAGTELKFWTLPAGEESWSLAGKGDTSFIDVQQTPDHRAIIATALSRRQMNGQVLRVDLATHEAQIIFDEPGLFSLPPVFHPSGKWMVLPVQELIKSAMFMSRPEVLAAECPQPRLQIRDVASGALLEDVVSPPSIANSAAFSPDGNTLATSGAGGVLLWDFSDPPGKSAAATVGQPFAAAGTLADGKKLDWAAYRGKVVLVTYWATWCQPCVAEIPDVKQAYDALHDRGFDVLAISLDTDQPVLKQFLSTREVPWHVVVGATAGASGPEHPLARKYGVDSIPKSFLLDRQGNIAVIDVRPQELAKLAEQLLEPTGEKKEPQ